MGKRLRKKVPGQTNFSMTPRAQFFDKKVRICAQGVSNKYVTVLVYSTKNKPPFLKEERSFDDFESDLGFKQIPIIKIRNSG